MRRRRVYGRTFQRGFGIVSALLALLVGSFVTMGVIQGKLTENQLNTGALQGDLLKQIADAANSYALENYAELQSGSAISRNGVTLAGGVALGQTLSPYVTDLIALGYLPPGTRRMATAVDGAFYKIAFRREPAGCVGSACQIPGLVYIDRPLAGSAADEMKGIVVGALMKKLGADAMVAFNSAPANLVSVGGASTPNPVAGAPAGVVGAKVGFGALGFGRFLVVGDHRDPNFQGNVTVAGDVQASNIRATAEIAGNSVVGSASVGAGTGNGGCRLGEVLGSGQILSRTADCIRVAWMDPVNGSVNAADAAGRNSIEIDGFAREVRMRDASGNVNFKVDGAGRIGSAGFAPTQLPYGFGGGLSTWDVVARATVGAWDGTNLRAAMNGAGDFYAFDSVGVTKAGILTSNGANRVYGEVLQAYGSWLPGQPCGPARGERDIAANSAGTGLVMCNGSTWIAISPITGSIGSACSPESAIASATDGTGLYCSGGRWISLADRMGRYVFSESYSASDGQSVPKPPCLSGTTGSLIYLIPRGEETAVRFVNRSATDVGGAWAISLRDGNGVAISGDVLALTYCAY